MNLYKDVLLLISVHAQSATKIIRFKSREYKVQEYYLLEELEEYQDNRIKFSDSEHNLSTT
jgi:hypothetical protein